MIVAVATDIDKLEGFKVGRAALCRRFIVLVDELEIGRCFE